MLSYRVVFNRKEDMALHESRRPNYGYLVSIGHGLHVVPLFNPEEGSPTMQDVSRCLQSMAYGTMRVAGSEWYWTATGIDQ